MTRAARRDSALHGWFSSSCYAIVVYALEKHKINVWLQEPGEGKRLKKCLALLCVKVIWPTVWELANELSNKSHNWAIVCDSWDKDLFPPSSSVQPTDLHFFTLSERLDKSCQSWNFLSIRVQKTEREFDIFSSEGGQGSEQGEFTESVIWV